MTEVIAGRIDFFFVALGPSLPHIRSGKLSALAVNGTHRAASLPEVPTTSEAGFANVEYPFWIGMFVPTKTPRNIVNKLHRETLKALQVPKVKDKLEALGVDPMVMTPADFNTLVEKEIAISAALVKAIALQAQ